MRVTSRILGLVGIAVRQLVDDPARTAFAIIGVAFAVLSVTLLFGVGTGVIQTGEELFDDTDRDLWVSGGPVEFQPGTVGGFQNPLVDSHGTADEIGRRDDVFRASPISFQAVYISPDGEEFDQLVGTGVRNAGSAITLNQGQGFSGSYTHYAGGDYDGPMTHEAIIDPGLADAYNLEVGDTLHVGGTISNAQRNEFEIVGISPTFSEFTGGQTVAIRLDELQTLTGTAYDDRATLITVSLEDGASPEAVQSELQQEYPEFTVRTNEEQLVAILERQALVIAGGTSLVGLSILAGMLLSLNLFLSLIYQQREQLAIFRAVGGSRSSTVVIALIQASFIAVVGCLLGLALSPVLAAALEYAALTLTGFEDLVQIPSEGYLVGVGVAIIFGLIGAAGSILRLSRSKLVAGILQ